MTKMTIEWPAVIIIALIIVVAALILAFVRWG